MADFNQITLIGRLGKDAEIRSIQSGDQVASFSIATDDGYKDKNGDWKKVTNWHQVVTFQKGLIKQIETRGKKGARVFVQGTLEYRSWKKEGEATDRVQAEIKIGPQDKFFFVDSDKPNNE
jgi:single-strand DNA-binding protein